MGTFQWATSLLQNVKPKKNKPKPQPKPQPQRQPKPQPIIQPKPNKNKLTPKNYNGKFCEQSEAFGSRREK